MDAYELVAARASSLELSVERYFVDDNCSIADYRGPQLIVVAHASRLVTIHELGRQIDELEPARMTALVELALLACDEPQEDFGFDTAIGRPTTSYRLRVFRALREAERSCRHAINHYDAHALHPAFTQLLTALRQVTGPLPPSAANAWDNAARWLGPGDLGALWQARRPVPLPAIINAFTEPGPVYFRAGQPPHRSELYRLDGNELAWLRDGAAPTPVTMQDGLRWILPCGGGVIEAFNPWQRPRRIYVRVDDPARGIYVQRE